MGYHSEIMTFLRGIRHTLAQPAHSTQHTTSGAEVMLAAILLTHSRTEVMPVDHLTDSQPGWDNASRPSSWPTAKLT